MNNKKNLLFYFLMVTTTIDFINGVLLTMFPKFPVSFGELFRVMLYLILLYILIKNRWKNKSILFLIIVAGYFFINTIFLDLFMNKSLKVLFTDFENVTKIVMPILIITVFYNYKKQLQELINECDNILLYSAVFVALSFVICKFLNIGYSAYEDSTGYRGFYNSLNELSIVLSVLYTFVINKIYMFKINKNKVDFKSIIILLLLAVNLALSGSKTGIIVIIIISLIYLVKLLMNKKFKVKITQIIFAFIGTSIIIICLFFVFHGAIFRIFDREMYFFENRDLISFVLSGRNILLNEALNKHVIGKENITTMLFGFRDFTNNATTFVNIELDGFVIFINYGLVGVVLITAFYLNIFIKAIKIKSTEIFQYKLSFIIMIMFSLAAGHVMFGAFAGTFLAIVSIPFVSENYN